MHTLRISFILIVTGALSACNSGTPTCNSNQAKDLVVSIARKQATTPYFHLSDDTLLTVKNVRTTEHQHSPEIYQCAADLALSRAGKEVTLPITYNIQKTDDNDGQFYINVFGL